MLGRRKPCKPGDAGCTIGSYEALVAEKSLDALPLAASCDARVDHVTSIVFIVLRIRATITVNLVNLTTAITDATPNALAAPVIFSFMTAP